MGKAAFCVLSLIVRTCRRNSSFVRSGVAGLFVLGEYRSTRPASKSPVPCCEQNWLIPSVRSNSSSRTATHVRRLGSARENRKELSSLSVLLCLKRVKPDRENCGGLGDSFRQEAGMDVALGNARRVRARTARISDSPQAGPGAAAPGKKQVSSVYLSRSSSMALI